MAAVANSQQHIILCCCTNYKIFHEFYWVKCQGETSTSSPKPHKEEELLGWGELEKTPNFGLTMWCGTRGGFPSTHRKTRFFFLNVLNRGTRLEGNIIPSGLKKNLSIKYFLSRNVYVRCHVKRVKNSLSQTYLFMDVREIKSLRPNHLLLWWQISIKTTAKTVSL